MTIADLRLSSTAPQRRRRSVCRRRWPSFATLPTDCYRGINAAVPYCGCILIPLLPVGRSVDRLVGNKGCQALGGSFQKDKGCRALGGSLQMDKSIFLRIFLLNPIFLLAHRNRYMEGTEDAQKNPCGHPDFNSYVQNLLVFIYQTDGRMDGQMD
jgi:hypothetical protein